MDWRDGSGLRYLLLDEKLAASLSAIFNAVDAKPHLASGHFPPPLFIN